MSHTPTDEETQLRNAVAATSRLEEWADWCVSCASGNMPSEVQDAYLVIDAYRIIQSQTATLAAANARLTDELARVKDAATALLETEDFQGFDDVREVGFAELEALRAALTDSQPKGDQA